MAWARRSGVMLCQPVDDKNIQRILDSAKSILVQPKLDGNRCWVDVNNGTLWSSEMNPILSMPHIDLAIKEFAVYNSGLILDGELYKHGYAHSRINGIVSRTRDIASDFASINYEVFDTKNEGIQIERLKILTDTINEFNNKCAPEINSIIRPVDYKIAHSQEDIMNIYNDYIEKGFEGIILRHPFADYVQKRPWTILKFKPKKKDWYLITGVIEAVSSCGEPKGYAGALACVDTYGNVFKVGTGIGMNHQKLAQILRDNPIGQFAEIHYQNLTDRGVPRFGKVISIVEKSGE